MCTMYNDQALPGFVVTRAFFRKVFTVNFNIGFGTPRQDVCSTCLQFMEKNKLTISPAEKNPLIIQQRIHKLRAKAFFKMLKDNREDLLILSFDCQKNLPLPRIPDQATYYSRHLYFYNFTIVIGASNSPLTKDNVKSYVWTEDVAPKSSNEIAPSVYHCLTGLVTNNKLNGIKTVRLIADGCGGQNKNSILITMI